MKASPQLEDGWTQYANELVEALAAMPFKSSRACGVCFLVGRMTYGMHKKRWWVVSLKELTRLMGGRSSTISEAVWHAIDRRVLINKPKKPRKMRLRLNKHYSEWRGFPEEWKPSFRPRSSGTPDKNATPDKPGRADSKSGTPDGKSGTPDGAYDFDDTESALAEHPRKKKRQEKGLPPLYPPYALEVDRKNEAG